MNSFRQKSNNTHLQIEHLQLQEVHEFKHGAKATDYAFETSFNETLVLSSESEEEDDEEECSQSKEGGSSQGNVEVFDPPSGAGQK